MIKAQTPPVFGNPLDIPIQLAANFGEVRPDHLHTGWDIRTHEKTGYPVHAAADGYLSRIKVSASGFGLVLYVTHPNGYMTVYAHLDHFNTAIGNFVKQQQYLKQSFEVELFPSIEKFVVKKGDVIAYSGNSGASGGPHLHFEIRDASGETYPLNPALLGLVIADTVKPVVSRLYLYPLSNNVNDTSYYYKVQKDSCDYSIKPDSIVSDYAAVGFGIVGADYKNGSSNDYGIYYIEEALDGKDIFSIKFDRLDFSNARYVNAHIDYAKLKQENITIHRLYRLPGDHNSIYRHLVNDGHIVLKDTFFHQVVITCKDEMDNTSYLIFYLRFSGKTFPADSSIATNTTFFTFNKPHVFSADSIRLQFPSDILYTNLNFQYSCSFSSSKDIYSAIFNIGNASIPLHSYYQVFILARAIPDSLKSKALIVYQNSGRESALVSHWTSEELNARAREFGYFYVKLDTIPPRIATAGIKQNQHIKKLFLRFYISDKLSGIATYNGYLDGKWILMEYDQKNNRLNCNLPTNLTYGEHRLNLIVTDQVNNKNSFTLTFKK
ncbi:MAG: M23 family metallopeptidase [Chitinophagales bacterium]|nr:M23 family metallopeptidase [Chitinophagales bacterium]